MRETADLSRRIEERKKKENKPNYLEKLTDERRSELMRIYGAKPKETKPEKKVPPKRFFKRTTSLSLPRKAWPFRIERNQKNIKLQDNRMSEPKIDPKKKPKIERLEYVRGSDHKKYEGFRFSEFLYIPSRDLPYGGWIQHCLFCHHETTSTEKIEEWKLYICNRCQKKHNSYEKHELCSEVIKYIRRLGY